MTLKYKIFLLAILIAAFLCILCGVEAQNHSLLSFDAQIASVFSTLHSPSLDNFALAVTKIGNPYQTFLIFLVLGIFFIAKRKKYYFYVFAIATGLGIALVEMMKVTIERVRPAMHLLLEAGYSFPSGHATISAIYLLSALILVAPLVQNRFSKIAWILLSVIIFPLVALSRIYLSVHFASDVLAGIILGSACFLFATTVTFHHHSYRE